MLKTDNDAFISLENGEEENVKNYLRANPKKINEAVGRMNGSFLHYAAEKGLESMCSFLISEEASLNFKNKQGNTPVHLAAENYHANVCDLLLQKKVDATIQNMHGNTPLHVAAENGCAAICERLLKEDNVKLSVTNNNGNTAIHVAADNGHFEVCKVLLNSITDQSVINVYNNDKRTALQLAAMEDYKTVFNLLMEHGALTDFDVFHQVARKLKNAEDDKTEGEWSRIFLKMFDKLLREKGKERRQIDVFTINLKKFVHKKISENKDNQLVSFQLSRSFSESIDNKIEKIFEEYKSKHNPSFFEDDVEFFQNHLDSRIFEKVENFRIKKLIGLRDEIKSLLENKPSKGVPNLLEVVSFDINLLNTVLKFVTTNSIDLTDNDHVVKRIMKGKTTPQDVATYPYVAFYVVLLDSNAKNSLTDKKTETLISKMVKFVVEKALVICKDHDNPLIFLLRLIAVLDQRAKKSPMLKADFLSIKADLLIMINEAMNINAMDDMKYTIPALVGNNEFIFSFLETNIHSPLAFALRHNIAEFIALPQSQELFELAWGYQSLQKALVPFYFEWDWELGSKTRRDFSISLYRQLPFLRAVVVFVFRVIFLGLTYLVLVEKDKQTRNYFIMTSTILFMALGYFIEEIHQFKIHDDYTSNFWNYVDIIILLTYLFWALPIWEGQSLVSLQLKDIILSVAVLFLLFRLLNFTSGFETTGVLVTMLIDMLKDVMNFALLYGFALLGFAVVFTVAFGTNDSFDSLSSALISLFSFSLGNSLFEWDTFEKDSLGSFGISLSLVYLIISSTVLMNLLTALFAVTLNIDEKDRYRRHCFLFAKYIQEHYHPVQDMWLPEPFCLFTFIFQALTGYQSNPYVSACARFLVSIVDSIITVAIVFPMCWVFELYLMLQPLHWKICCDFIQDKDKQRKKTQGTYARVAFNIAFFWGWLLFICLSPFWFLVCLLYFFVRPKETCLLPFLLESMCTMVSNLTYIVMIVSMPVWFSVVFFVHRQKPNLDPILSQHWKSGYTSISDQTVLEKDEHPEYEYAEPWESEMRTVLEKQIEIYMIKTKTAQNAELFDLENRLQEKNKNRFQHLENRLEEKFSHLEHKIELLATSLGKPFANKSTCKPVEVVEKKSKAVTWYTLLDRNSEEKAADEKNMQNSTLPEDDNKKRQCAAGLGGFDHQSNVGVCEEKLGK